MCDLASFCDIFYDFDTFSRKRGCIVPFRFTRPPRTGDDGVEDGRKDFAFEYQVRLIFHNFAIFYDFDTFLDIAAVLSHFVSLVPRGRGTIG